MKLPGYLATAIWATVLLTPRGMANYTTGTQPLKYELDIRSFGAVCDGRDDSQAVQAAIDALPDGGTLTVSCRAGIGSSPLILRGRTGVTIAGTRGGGFQVLEPIPQRLLLMVGECSGCTIADLAIDGGNAGTAAIWLERCTNTTVRNNTITNIGYPAQAAIVGIANRNNRYVGNLIANTGIRYRWDGEIHDATRGMWLGNEKPDYYEWNPYIAENRLRNIGGTAIVTHAFSAVIVNNVGENLLWSGVKVVAPKGSTGTTRVANNTFTGAGGFYSGGNIQLGSELGNRETIVVENNTVDGDRDSGIYVARGALTGRLLNNTIRNAGNAGITLLSSADKVEMRGNRILNVKPGKHYQGIRIIAESGCAIRNLEIADNEIRGHTENGILLQSNSGIIDGVSIHSNTLIDNGWYGVYIEEKAERNTIRNIAIGPNQFVGNRLGPLADMRVVAHTAP